MRPLIREPGDTLPMRYQAVLGVPARMTVAIAARGAVAIGGPIQRYAGQSPPAVERPR
jgi:hypothetical protein